jgi:hypothetical protein
MEFLLLKLGYFSNKIISQWVEVLNIDLRICSNSNFICPQNVPVISKNFQISLGVAAPEFQAVWAC